MVQLTPKRIVLWSGVISSALAAATLAGLGVVRASVAVVALMAGAVAFGVADVRRRIIEVACEHRQTASRQRAIMDRIESLERSVVEVSGEAQAALSTTREQILDAAGQLRTAVAPILNETGRTVAGIAAARAQVSAVSDAIGELMTAAGDLGGFQRYALRQTRDDIVAAVRNVDATLQLSRSFTPRGPLPPTGGWALNAQNLLLLTALARRTRPRRIVELGSGTSTIWLGLIAEETGAKMISFDHLESYAEFTRVWLDHNELGATVELRVAPLEDVKVGGVEQPWYALSAFADLSDIDLLVVDGPPQATSSQARYPAFPLLAHRLADEALIVLDDAGRSDEQGAFARWLDEEPRLEQLPSGSESLAIFRFRRLDGNEVGMNAIDVRCD